MRILITGGFGFIGGRLAQYLSHAGHAVVLGSRSLCDAPDWLPDADVAETVWADESSLRNICDGVDVVIHAAGMNANDCLQDSVAAIEFNGVATARLVHAALSAGVKRFVYLSTVHVYASPLTGIITESSCPQNLHPYASSHLAGEAAVLWAGCSDAMLSIVLRISSVYGVPAHKQVNCWGLLVNDLCRQLAETGRMVLRGSGLDTRDFIPMGAVCRVIGMLLDRGEDDWHGVVNLGSGTSTSVLDMARSIQKLCSSHAAFLPEIIVGQEGGGDLPGWTYMTHRLKALGISAAGDGSAELEALFRYCFTMYGRGGI